MQGRRQYVTLGSSKDGWTQARAQEALPDELAKVQLGTWKAPEPDPALVVEQDPTFHVFASDWLAAHEGEWRKSTKLDYEWQLSYHLLPFFKRHRLSQITIAEVDRYRAEKVKGHAERHVDQQDDHSPGADPQGCGGVRDSSSATRPKGKRRRLKASKSAPVWLDSAEQIEALLDAAGEIDRTGSAPTIGCRVGRSSRRWLFAGLRIGELIDPPLARRGLRRLEESPSASPRPMQGPDARSTSCPSSEPTRAHKAAQGGEQTKVISLDAHRARRGPSRTHSGERVFPTQADGPMNPNNVRNRILTPAAVEGERTARARPGQTPLPDGLTPAQAQAHVRLAAVALGTTPAR